MRIRTSLTLAGSAAILAVAGGLTTVPAAQASTPTYGTVSGTLTNQENMPLNGMCVNLYHGGYANGNPITTAPTGTGGPNGFFTQANVPVGNYVAFFWNCAGANVGGKIDPNFVNIFYGNTYIPAKATKFAVTKNATTSLGTNPIPLGGTITGTVTDSTRGGPAIYEPAVGILIPGAAKLNLDSNEGWYIGCADSNGRYSISGVPAGGVRVVFAPTDWGCVYDSNGDYNFGFYNQSESGTIGTTADGTMTVNGKVTEGSSYPSSGSAGPAGHATGVARRR